MDPHKQLIGIFGGSFDPVHIGHIRLIIELLEKYAFKEIRLIPCHQNVLKKPSQTNKDHRLKMLRLATSHLTKIAIDEQEILKDSPSYTFTTLQTTRTEVGSSQPLAFIMGSDAFKDFHLWYHWQEIASLTNIIIIPRDNIKNDFLTNISQDVASFFKDRITNRFNDIVENVAGKIMICDVPLLAISATRIRTLLEAKKNIRYLIPDSVLEYIQSKQLYCNK